MPRTILLHDRTAILARLADHRGLNVYAVGDLDDLFFPYTAWFALEERGQLLQIAMLYTAASPPVLHAITADRVDHLRTLLSSLIPVLPRSFYMHVTPGAVDVLSKEYTLYSRGLHRKMLLVDSSRIDAVDTSAAVALGPSDRKELEAFYAIAYPGNWFDPRMLETRRFAGVRVDGELASVAGIHVLSGLYRVAALGNIATSPGFRGKGLGRVATAAVCRMLLPEHTAIGLNVHSENTSAIRLYERLGFTVIGSYEEILATARA